MIGSKKISRTKRLRQKFVFALFTCMSAAIVLVLVVILGFIVVRGLPAISWDFITKMPEDGMTRGGIYPAIIGTFCLMLGSMIFAFPIGILSGIYVNEYTRDGLLKRFIKQMTNNLAGIPSIVFGLFGMSLFVNDLHFGDSILAGSLTLGLLALPVVIRTTEEALKSIDDSFRIGSYALGATKLQTIRKVVMPMALPNIITGLILSIGRISGETAPILFTVAAYFLPKLPHSIFDQVMALPYHLYVIATSGTNIVESRKMAYGTALVLVFIVLILNLLANVLRRYFGKKVKMH
jgi:phosphate transport system permease protein